jgi:hypothetical protein
MHLGPAPAGMRSQEAAQPAAVVEVLRTDTAPDRLGEALRAETRPPAPRCPTGLHDPAGAPRQP